MHSTRLDSCCGTVGAQDTADGRVAALSPVQLTATSWRSSDDEQLAYNSYDKQHSIAVPTLLHPSLQLSSLSVPASSPVSPTFSGVEAASEVDSSSEDDVLHCIAQSARRGRRPNLLESESDVDSSPQTASPALHLMSNVVPFVLPNSPRFSAQPGIDDARTGDRGVQQQLDAEAEVVVINSSDDEAPVPINDVFELSPSSRFDSTQHQHAVVLAAAAETRAADHNMAECRSATDVEDSDKENDASHQLAAQLAGLQIMPCQTPTRPVQTMKLFSSVPPKLPGSLHRQIAVATPAFKRQRESLAYEMFHEYGS